MMNIEIFRQYDIRGHADRDLTDETVREIGQAFGSYVLDSGSNKVLVGRDNRLSSERLHKALLEGLLDAGCHVVDIGLVVTPILYFAREYCKIDGGSDDHRQPQSPGG